MKTLYLDLRMGAAGDMLAGALADLFDDKKALEDELNSLGIPGVQLSIMDDEKCGIKCSHYRVLVHGHEEKQDEGFAHHHEHHHGNDLMDIRSIVSSLKISARVHADVMAVYRMIADAEGKVHGREVDEIHFHEVGAKDAIADITAVAYMMEKLGYPQVQASPIRTGYGQVKCAHGILPVPAPATAELLTGMLTYAGDIKGEMCTPTGAALIKYYASDICEMPMMNTQRIGMGSGNKDFEAANIVRAVLGDKPEMINELSFNVDDMTGEDIGYLQEVLFENGALDVYTTQIGMKKSRPGVLITVLCKREDKEKMAQLIFKHSTTIGIRIADFDRVVLTREAVPVETQEGTVHIKKSEGFGVIREKMEYEDVKAIAKKTGKSLYDVRKEI